MTDRAFAYPQFLDILTALRELSMPVYLRTLAQLHDDEAAYQAAVKAVGAYAKKRGDADASNLTPLLGSQTYQQFINILNQRGVDEVGAVQILLESKEYEQRLRRIKERDVSAYVANLRVIGPDEIRQAIADGTIVNAIDSEGNPEPIRDDEDFSGAFLDQPTATAMVDARLLADVLAEFHGPDPVAGARPQGLRMRQVAVIGPLSLNWYEFGFPVGFEGCSFDGTVTLDHVTVPWLSFDTCDFSPGLGSSRGSGQVNASGIVITDTLRFWGCQGLTQLFLPDARIGDFAPVNPDAEIPTSRTAFRTVLDGAHFGRILVPEDPREAFPIDFSRSFTVDSVVLPPMDNPGAVADLVYAWLSHDPSTKVPAKKRDTKAPDLPQDVWWHFEDALRRSGHSAAATQFGIKGARARTYAGRWGAVKRLVLGPTVRYFYDNLRALWFLAGLFALTWLLSFVTAEHFTRSPLANSSWLSDESLAAWVDRGVWSFLYSIDTTLSPLSLGQADTVWPASPWLAAVYAVIKGVSLVLLGLFLTGATGLTERKGRG